MLLAVVETLEEFRNILLGQKIRVYTDHKNLTFKNFNVERVMRWRLLVEECNPELMHAKGKHNVAADALSRLNLLPSETLNEIQMAECCGSAKSKLPTSIFPLRFKEIQRAQQADPQLLEKLRSHEGFDTKSFSGGAKTRDLVFNKNFKICVPNALQQPIIDWHHVNLVHPGENWTEETMRQHCTWPGLKEQVKNTIKHCPTCQTTKQKSRM